MLLAWLALFGGLAVLAWSADYFVDGAATTSKRVKIPPIIVGMIVLGFGTSAPEMVVSALASWQGNYGLAIGNVYGSNITNITFILGLGLLLYPMTVERSILKKDLPVLIAITLLLGFLTYDLVISRLEAGMLLILFFIVLIWMVKREPLSSQEQTEQDQQEALDSLGRAVFKMLVGFICLIVSSRILLWGAVDIAVSLGIDDVIIGLTIVALGTSLPELAATVAALRQKEHDLALGNIVGSNLFNSLVVLGLAGVIQPLQVHPDLLLRDWPIMVGITAVLMLFIGLSPKQTVSSSGGVIQASQASLGRIQGLLFVLMYLSYMGWLVYKTQL